MSQYWEKHVWDNEKKQRALLKFAKEKNIFGKKINISDLENDPIFKQMPGKNEKNYSSYY